MDARRFDDCQVIELVKAQAAASAAAASSGSGAWVDISNYQGDILVICDLGSVTGTLGSVNVQVQVADDASGTNATNALDPDGTLATLGALGSQGISIDTAEQPKKFLGVSTTFTTVTACVISITAVARGRGVTPNV